MRLKPYLIVIINARHWLVYCLLLLASNTAIAQLQSDFTISKTEGCSPLLVNLTNTSTGTNAGTNYSWDFGNGNHSNEKDAGAIYVASGNYTITLTIKEGTKQSTKSTLIKVYPNPIVDFTADIIKGCAPLKVEFIKADSAFLQDGPVYFWDFGDGNTFEETTAGKTTHEFTFAQHNSISLTVTNSFGCQSTIRKDSMIEVLPVFNASFTAQPPILCKITEPAKFINSSTVWGNTSYNWDFGDGTTAVSKDPVHVYAKRDVYDITLFISNTAGCKSTLTKPGFINAANFSSSFTIPPLVCNGSLFELVNTSTPKPIDVIWSIAGWDHTPYYSTDSSITYNISTPGKYTARMVNIYSSTCSDTVYKAFEVNKVPDLTGIDFKPESICGAPVKVVLRDTSTEAVSWEWRLINDETIEPFATTKIASYTFPYPGIHYTILKVKAANGCSASVAGVMDLDTPKVRIFPMAPFVNESRLVGCVGSKFGFFTSSAIEIVSYKWTFPDGSTSTVANPQHVFNNAGDYQQVILEFTDKNGCSGKSAYTEIYISEKPIVEVTALSGVEICGNTSIEFLAKGNNYYTYYWNFNDGSDNLFDHNYWIYESRVKHKYQSTGFKTVQLIVYNGNCPDTITKKDILHINAPFPRIEAAKNTCDGNRGIVTFLDNSSETDSWHWDFGDGRDTTYSIYAPSIIHQYGATGYYSAVLTTVRGNCTVKDSVTLTVLLKQSPILITSGNESCSNNNPTFEINGLERNYHPANSNYAEYAVHQIENDSGDFAYVWLAGFTRNDQGSYTGNLFGVDNFRGKRNIRIMTRSAVFSCIDTTNYIPFNIGGPLAGFYLDSGTCSKIKIRLVDTSKTYDGVPIVKRVWDLGDGTVITNPPGNSVEHQYSYATNYYISLDVTDANGCSNTLVKYAYVGGLRASFSSSATTISPGSQVSFSNQSIDDSQNSTYEWHFGDGTKSIGFDADHIYNNPGSYRAMLIAIQPTCRDTAYQTITVRTVNSAFSFQTSFIKNSGCPPVLVNFSNTSSGSAKVKWDFGDGTISDNVFNPGHTYNKAGTYAVKLIVYSDNGTSYTTIDSVQIGIDAAAPVLNASSWGGCTSQPIQLSTTAKGTDYAWDFGDGTVHAGSDSFSIHPFNSAGVFNPSLIFTNSDGCRLAASVDRPVIIDSLSIQLNNIPAILCDEANITLFPTIISVAADQAGLPLQYHWDFGTGISADTSADKNTMIRYQQPGSYMIKLKVISPLGCSKEVQKGITVNETIVSSINGPVQICEKEFISPEAIAPIIEGPTWTWDFGNGNTGKGKKPGQQKFTSPGQYNIQLITDNKGCTDTSTLSLKVNAAPRIDMPENDLVVCAGKSVQLMATGGNKYHWQPSTWLDNTEIGNPLATPEQDIRYTVTASSEAGCIATDSIQIKIAKDFLLTAPPDTAICEGAQIQLNVSGAYQYKWINETDGLSNLNIGNPIAKPTTSKLYQVQASDQYSCFTKTESIYVTVNKNPKVDAGDDIHLNGNQPHQFKPVISSDVIKWQWSPPDYLNCVNCEKPVSQPKKDITYSITVTNENGCIAVDQVSIHIGCDEKSVHIPNAFTPNNDGRNERFYITASGIAVVNYLNIYNRFGQLVFQQKNTEPNNQGKGWDGKFNGRQQPAGSYVYFTEMECFNGEKIIKKGSVVIIY